MKLHRIAVACFLTVLACSFIVAGEHTTDSLATVKKNVDSKKAVLLDVREKGEWDAGHLQGAELLPLTKMRTSATAESLEKQFAKGSIIYIHCASGRRCLPAADILKKHGYDARPLREGYEALLKGGFPKAEK